MRGVKSLCWAAQDMIRRPVALPAEGPAFHEPDGVGVALLERLHEA